MSTMLLIHIATTFWAPSVCRALDKIQYMWHLIDVHTRAYRVSLHNFTEAWRGQVGCPCNTAGSSWSIWFFCQCLWWLQHKGDLIHAFFIFFCSFDLIYKCRMGYTFSEGSSFPDLMIRLRLWIWIRPVLLVVGQVPSQFLLFPLEGASFLLWG